MANYKKPQSPLQHKDGDYFYPLTTIDQIITDNDTRLNAELISVDLTDAVEGDTNMGINADTLNGKTIEEIKQQIYDEMINYSVIGSTTEPANPTENMIWINTDQEITDYVFSKNEPKNPIEGMVWIVTGNNSSAPFYSLNMNGKEFDEVYPLSVKQMVSGNLVDKAAMIYQGDKWVDWIYYIINGSYAKITGISGFTTAQWSIDSDGLHLSRSSGQSSKGVTTNTYELTGKTKFTIVATTVSGADVMVSFCSATSDTMLATITMSTGGTYTLDVTNINQLCRLRFDIDSGRSAIISQMYLE